MGSESEVHFLQLLTGTVVDLIPEDPTIKKLKAKFDKFETLTSGTGWAGAFNIHQMTTSASKYTYVYTGS